MPLIVVVTLDFCNLRLLLIIAKLLVEHFEEDGKYRIVDILTKSIMKFLNVEKDAFGRYFASLLNLTFQFKVIVSFLCKNFCTRATFNDKFIFENI